MGQFLLACAVVAVSSCVALAVWHYRDAFAFIAAALVGAIGLRVAWELLPFSSATRAAWKRGNELRKRDPLIGFNSILYAGIFLLANVSWDMGVADSFQASNLIVPSILILLGAIGISVRRFINLRNGPKRRLGAEYED